MSESLVNNQQALNQCLDIYRSTSDAQFALAIAGKQTEADQLTPKLSELQKEIDQLRGKMLDDWTAQVPQLNDQLTQISNDVQQAVTDIKSDIQAAQQVVSLIGKLDQAIKVIKPLISGLPA